MTDAVNILIFMTISGYEHGAVNLQQINALIHNKIQRKCMTNFVYFNRYISR